VKEVSKKKIVKEVIEKEKNDSGRTCCPEPIGSVGFEQSLVAETIQIIIPFVPLACKIFLAHETYRTLMNVTKYTHGEGKDKTIASNEVGYPGIARQDDVSYTCSTPLGGFRRVWQCVCRPSSKRRI
jgi:hypothetical protein